MRRYSVAHLSALSLPPPQLIDAAARAGYDYVSLRCNRTTAAEPMYDLINDRALQRETRAALKSAGLQVWDVEVARMDPRRDHEHYRPLLEAAAKLGARHVITQLPDDDRNRAIDRFAALCDMAHPLGIACDLEFVSWTQVPGLLDAAAILRAANRPNAGLLVDTLHFDRSDSSLEDLAALPKEWFTWAQICDAPAERPNTQQGLLHHAREERLFPGEGGINVRAILDQMPPNIVYSLEIPSVSRTATMGAADYIKEALAHSKAHLD